MPIRRVIMCPAVSSRQAPNNPRFLAGAFSRGGAVSRPRPAAAVAPEPTKTNGISGSPAGGRRPAVGMINAFGALGGFAGTYIVGALGGGTSGVPFVFLAACLFVAALLMLAVRRPGQTAHSGPAGHLH